MSGPKEQPQPQPQPQQQQQYHYLQGPSQQSVFQQGMPQLPVQQGIPQQSVQQGIPQLSLHQQGIPQQSAYQQQAPQQPVQYHQESRTQIYNTSLISTPFTTNRPAPVTVQMPVFPSVDPHFSYMRTTVPHIFNNIQRNTTETHSGIPVNIPDDPSFTLDFSHMNYGTDWIATLDGYFASHKNVKLDPLKTIETAYRNIFYSTSQGRFILSISQILQLLSIYRNTFRFIRSSASNVIFLNCVCMPPEKNVECGLSFCLIFDVSRNVCYLTKSLYGSSHNHDYRANLKKCEVAVAESRGSIKRHEVVVSNDQSSDSTKTSKKRLSDDECVLPIPKQKSYSKEKKVVQCTYL
ncbi:unnamed protein product [Ambrosiozyma monospora]|uniref:Unnamed protein product n=1 Tax=Ambrosiozyma monospora TaxID=43982 RepID=A0ACB5TW71_AMBMO|nr:unnamed protein product [Ambrosiozyma monospora]